MKIKFGIHIDLGCWPEFAHDQQASIGEISLGPLGLIGVLETSLGLIATDVPEALRIRRYMERLQSLPQKSRFYTRSCDSDAWATARELLQWRDELVMYGWNPHSSEAPDRISTLAEIEQVRKPLGPGLADRFQIILHRLNNSPSVNISRIELQEPFELLPTTWQKLFNTLKTCGVSIEQAAIPNNEIQEIVLLQSEDIWPLAQTVSAWLSGTMHKNDTVLLCQQDTGQLDLTLHGMGLPATGRISKSAQLNLFQLLPLLLENIWKPVRLERLMELFSVPESPVPGFAARALSSAIAKEPGLESRKWQEALETIRHKKHTYLLKEGLLEEEAVKAAEEFVSDLDKWLRASRVDADSETPSLLVVSVVQRLARHLAKISARLPSAKIAMGHCRDMLKVLEGISSISKPLIERILDDVIGPGRAAGNLREAAPWGVISDPSQLIAPVDSLVWWGFTDQSLPTAEVWSESERNWLAEQGIRLDRPQLARSCERFYWKKLLLNCRQLLLCQPLAVDGKAIPVHPLWFEIESDPELKAKTQSRHVFELLNHPGQSLMGLKLNLNQVALKNSMPVFSVKPVPANPDFLPEKLSPSSIGTLLGCSFKWLLENLEIKVSDMMKFPEQTAMIGTLAHQVLEDVLTASENISSENTSADTVKRFAIPNPDNASYKAVQQFEVRVPQMAAELMLPENMSEYESLKRRIADAAADICRLMINAGFVSVSCEEWIHTRLNNIQVNGRADVIAYNAEGRPHIIDFKYSYANNFYRDKIIKGCDVQLIVYSRMLGEENSPVAYYLVPKRMMLTNSSKFRVDVVDTESVSGNGWMRVQKSVGSALTEIRNGKVIAQGLLDEEALKARETEYDQVDKIYLDPPCRFCDYQALCGLNADQTVEGRDE
jgi:ATP-dependent helicase/nuclease subunit B